MKGIETNHNKGFIMTQIYGSFISSSDYNGLAFYNLQYHSFLDSIKYLIELIREDAICIIGETHDVNPHIIRFGFPSKEKQVDYLQQYDSRETVCLYPSPSYLEKHRDVSKFELMPYDKRMALGHPQLKACYFKYDILHNYASDPRICFEFSDYSGRIYSDEEVEQNQYINLKTFGIGRQKGSIIVVSFPKYLRNMSTSNQYHWLGFEIIDNVDCKTLNDYINNQFRGCWAFPNTVYRSILHEIYNINELTNIAFKNKLFRKEYTKDELFKFDMLTFSSLDCYNSFLLLLEKVVISNLNFQFFLPLINTMDSDGKNKGTLHCLKEWITKVNKDCTEEIHKPLKRVRDERQAPAHKIEANKYDNEFLLKQHHICAEVYASLNLLRRLIQTHPEVHQFSIKYPNTQYIEF